MSDYDHESLAARQEIVDVTVRYGVALDTRDWALLRTCFTDGATADFGPWGQATGVAEIIAAAQPVMEGMDATQHVVSGHVVVLDGDRAAATCTLVAEHLLVTSAGQSTSTTRGIYRDRFVRQQEGGWRIEHRQLEVTWREGNVGIFDEAFQRSTAAQKAGNDQEAEG